jgi:hypothetical protein
MIAAGAWRYSSRDGYHLHRLAQQYPGDDKGRGVIAIPLREHLIGDARRKFLQDGADFPGYGCWLSACYRLL